MSTNERLSHRARMLLFSTLEILRKEIRPQFSDWKDADDWLFSQLDFTKEELSQIYKGRDVLYYDSSAVDFDVAKKIYESSLPDFVVSSEVNILGQNFYLGNIKFFLAEDHTLQCKLPDESVPRNLRLFIQDVREGDAFFFGETGTIRTTSDNAYQNHDEQDEPWVVYGDDGEVYFEEDIGSSFGSKVKDFLIDLSRNPIEKPVFNKRDSIIESIDTKFFNMEYSVKDTPEIAALKGEICNLRHELDGISGYDYEEELAPLIEKQLFIRECQLCAAIKGVQIEEKRLSSIIFNDDLADEIIKAGSLEDYLENNGFFNKSSLVTKIESAATRSGISYFSGNFNGILRENYSKFSTEELVEMEKSAYADYYKLATKPTTNPSKEDLEPLEKATAAWEAISEELRSRKSPFTGQLHLKATKPNATDNLIKAMTAYGLEYSWSDSEIIDALTELGITYDDFCHAGAQDFVKGHIEVPEEKKPILSQIHKLAADIDQFTFNNDTYEYVDRVVDREQHISDIEAQIHSGQTEALSKYLSECLEETDYDDDYEAIVAKDLLARLDKASFALREQKREKLNLNEIISGAEKRRSVAPSLDKTDVDRDR